MLAIGEDTKIIITLIESISITKAEMTDQIIQNPIVNFWYIKTVSGLG